MPSPSAEPRVLVVDDSIVVRHILVLTLRQLPQLEPGHHRRGRQRCPRPGKTAGASLRPGALRRAHALPGRAGAGASGRGELGDITTPIFLISTLGSEQDVQRGLEAGATAYILMPLSPYVILKTVEAHLGGQPKPEVAT